MIIGIGKEAIISNIYDEDDVVRQRIRSQLERILQDMPKGQIFCVGKYKNGISMDFCKICANMNILNEVVVPYDGNDWGWPAPIKNQFQTILDKAKRVKRLHNGGFNPKKIKDMEAYISKMSDIVINITVDSDEVKINLVTK